ncbi:MAG: DUF2817 domain-containing protein [Nitrososphaeria archaeon]|nr:DUF2817 domain-containing protein [Nitrososphaeria archaeon]
MHFFKVHLSSRKPPLKYSIKLLIPIILLSVILFNIILYHYSLQENIKENVSGIEDDYVKNVLEGYISRNMQGLSYNICGYSVQGKPVYYYTMGKGEICVLIIGGLHGDEPKGTYACLELIEYLSKNENLTSKYNFIIIPLCNPDGAKEFKRRNYNNVDLNRDFYTKSQPETSAIINLFHKRKPIILIDVHESQDSMPIIIYANNSKSSHLASFISLQNNIPALLAANVGQSANFAEKENIYGIILELPRSSWKYGNGTIILFNIIETLDLYISKEYKTLSIN